MICLTPWTSQPQDQPYEPHGNWEREVCYETNQGGDCSLPLMGIGNRDGVDGLGSHLTLITPHGDWELLPSRRRSVRPETHYPSWGLGTGLVSAATKLQLSLITPHGDWEPLAFNPISRVDDLQNEPK